MDLPVHTWGLLVSDKLAVVVGDSLVHIRQRHWVEVLVVVGTRGVLVVAPLH